MSQDNRYPKFGQQGPQQYGLSSFDTPNERKGLAGAAFGASLREKFKSPLFATAALLLAGVAFAGILIAAYPDGGEDNVPVVKADTLAYKETPNDPGGMSIPNRDSTIFAGMGSEGTGEEPPVENLLEEQPVDKLAAFARQVEEEAAETDKTVEEVVEDLSTLAEAQPEEASSEESPLQKIAKTREKPQAPKVEEQVVASAPVNEIPEPVKPKVIHKAGENPETLEFVRSVLDNKDSSTTTASAGDVATNAASVEPASGTPATVTPGSYYVQLGSVKSMSGAETEWGKLQSAFSGQLSGLSHRVQSADLGDRGTFYRIQAGPISKESAAQICDAIKAQKPGGCLVTQ